MRALNNSELEVFSRLRATIFTRSARNSLRSRFVEGEERLQAHGFTIPPGMERLQVALSWPAKVVSAFSSRQVPSGFISTVDTSLTEDAERIYADNNFHSLERWVIQAANQHGCAFVFATPGDTNLGEPEVVLTARTALTATAELDPRSRRVTEALELVGMDRAVWHRPGRTLTLMQGQAGWQVEFEEELPTSLVTCAPYVTGGSLEKPFGVSRVTRTVMDLTYQGARTLLRQEVAAEFYQAPRLALMGADESIFTDPVTGRQLSPLEMLTGAIWNIPDVDPEEAREADMDPRLQRVEMKQLHQASMQPFGDQFRTIAANLAAAASIPLQYMGVVSDSNPSSAEAIRALENDLVYEAKAQFPSLDIGRNLLIRAVLSLVHGNLDEAARNDLRAVKPDWEDPTTRSVSEHSQFVAQQVQIGNLQAGGKTALSLLPMSQAARDAAYEENQRAMGGSLLDRALGRVSGTDGAGTDDAESVDPEAEQAREQAMTQKAQFDALGVAVRAGVEPEDAAQRVGLAGIKFTGAVPVALRMPEREAASLEEK